VGTLQVAIAPVEVDEEDVEAPGEDACSGQVTDRLRAPAPCPTSVTSCCNQIWESGTFVATNYDQDIVWADGFMVRSPIGQSLITVAAP